MLKGWVAYKVAGRGLSGGGNGSWILLIETYLQCTTMGTLETLASLTWYSMRIREVGYLGTPYSQANQL